MGRKVEKYRDGFLFSRDIATYQRSVFSTVFVSAVGEVIRNLIFRFIVVANYFISHFLHFLLNKALKSSCDLLPLGTAFSTPSIALPPAVLASPAEELVPTAPPPRDPIPRRFPLNPTRPRPREA